jgi:predicted N-acyltransferase
MQIETANSILDIPAYQWDNLNSDGNPFTSYAFLSALEESGSIGEETGWVPRYLLMWDNKGLLVGALPMYEKHHSWGEYVFDWAWANAWQQCGLAYYPKLIVAVPFSPVSGHRFLVAAEIDQEKTIQHLQSAAVDYAKNESYSSLHYLFPTQYECEILQQQGLLIRHDVQFHWTNNDYQDFKGFLATMNSRKRKKISRERRRVSEMGVEFKIVNGQDLTARNMEEMYAFYLSTIMAHLSTIMAHSSQAYLSKDFFLLLGERLADDIVLIEASYQGEAIAAALNIRHDSVLYGRYWGCKEEYHSLHFETCYYQAIDYCISNGLSCFEGGAQGEHKLSRGFLPVITCSAHWMADQRLTSAISDFLSREKAHVAHYQQLLSEHSPYRNSAKSS